MSGALRRRQGTMTHHAPQVRAVSGHGLRTGKAAHNRGLARISRVGGTRHVSHGAATRRRRTAKHNKTSQTRRRLTRRPVQHHAVRHTSKRGHVPRRRHH